MATMISSIATPAFVGLKAQSSQKVSVKVATPTVSMAAPRCSLSAERLGAVLVATGASLLVASSAMAGSLVKMGADDGSLVFSPSSLSVSAGETVTFKNNAGFPHNVVFDEDAVPGGINADSLSHEEYFNAPGETYDVTFSKAGTYEYYCEPHQGAGMAGKIVVS